MTKNPGLHQVPEAELVRLLRAIAGDRLAAPITRAGLLLGQFAAIEGQLDVIVGQSKQAAITLLSAVLRERRERPSHGVSVIWDGPAPSGTGTRSAHGVVLELIATAQRSVLFTGVDLQRDRSLLRSLHAALQGRALEVLVILQSVEPAMRAQLATLADDVLHDSPLRALILVPEPQYLQGPLPFCLLVDQQRGAILAGAPPQPEADESAVTAGWLIDHSEAVLALEAQWRALVHSTALCPLDRALSR